MASPSPCSGTGATAIAPAPLASSARSITKRLAAASVQVTAAGQVQAALTMMRTKAEKHFAGLRRARIHAQARTRRVVRTRVGPALRYVRAGSVDSSSTTVSKASRLTPPGRNSRTASPGNTATMVDSRPTCAGPASSIRPDCSPSSASTSCAVVGLMRPERLAEGAASGRPKARISFERHRMTRHAQRNGLQSGTRKFTDLVAGATGSTSVSGPGQKRSARRCARSSSTASLRRHVKAGYMCDQRIELRASFRRIDAGNGQVTARVCSEPVDRLGRQTDEPGTAQAIDGLRDSRFARLNDTKRRPPSAGLRLLPARVPEKAAAAPAAPLRWPASPHAPAGSPCSRRSGPPHWRSPAARGLHPASKHCSTRHRCC